MDANNSATTLVVGFLSSAVKAIRRQDKSEQTYQLLVDLLDKHDIDYQENNWDALDIASSTYLYLSLLPNSNTTAIINDFMALPFVESAFIKPEGTLPS